ncbi:fumarylacetoacetase [Dyadobacter sp. LHD-138]|uniref:fumarylacetoacetase n=1 Tax=Dyadobacter sp. LHD-138 TaxID=3071413 RepID=UPI0027E2064E|nr:fumarylacetoacetase [Dyadobacter sp. LHD-138]MDQ6481979.1 fumarylacetoacetase [Dyadobacter sp. LHD-138]
MQFHSSWLPIPAHSDFSLHNLPFGIFSTKSGEPRVGVAIGEWIMDMTAAHEFGFFKTLEIDAAVFKKETLNDLIALGRMAAKAIRLTIQQWLTDEHSPLKEAASRVLIRQTDARMHMPLRIGNYTDFYSSEEHAMAVGKLYRPENPLLPNWKHMPIAYHGRASSVVLSGTAIHRPLGQTKPGASEYPVFGPTAALDFELELAFVVGKNSELGKPVSMAAAEDHLFGVVLFNDWSARDIQRWEYQPLGPFASKNFASSIAPWVITMDALEAFRVEGPVQAPVPMPYLQTTGPKNFDIHLSAAIQPKGFEETVVTETNAKYLYWNIHQQTAHHTITGCNLNTGDLLATGTISIPGPKGAGCLLEATKGGKQPLNLTGGLNRTFLEDGDEVIIRGFAERDGIKVGFGEVRGEILPSLPDFI